MSQSKWQHAVLTQLHAFYLNTATGNTLQYANKHDGVDTTVNLSVGQTLDTVLDCAISGQAILRTVLISVLISILGRHNTHHLASAANIYLT